MLQTTRLSWQPFASTFINWTLLLMDRCEGKAIIRLTANYNRLLNGVDGLITFISGNRRRQSLLVRFSRLLRCDPAVRPRIFITRVYQQVIATGSPLLSAKNSPLFSQMYSIRRADPRFAASPGTKREGKKMIHRGWGMERIGAGKGSFVKRVCRYHESSSSSSLLQSVQPCKNASPILPSHSPSARHPRKRSVRESRIYFTGFRHVTGRASSIRRGWKIRPSSSRLARRNVARFATNLSGFESACLHHYRVICARARARGILRFINARL